jgi:hypothetical protein
VRRAEDYAALGAEVVVELQTESHAAKPSTRRGRSPAAPTTPTAATPTASSAASATRPTAPPAPTAPADPNKPGEGDGCRCPLIPSRPRRASTPADSLATHPYQGSPPGLVSAGSHLLPGRTMHRWRPLPTARFRWHMDQTWTSLPLPRPAGWGRGHPMRWRSSAQSCS